MIDYALWFVVFFVITLTLKIYLALTQARYIAQRSHSVPDLFKAHLSLEEHKKAARYSVQKLKLSMFEELTHGLLVMCLTLFLGLHMIRLFWAGVVDQPGSWNDFMFEWGVIFSVGLISWLIGVPFGLYRQFKLEADFGFNTMTPKLFVLDSIKSIILAVVIGTPILFGVLWCFYNISHWWFFAWALLSLVQIALMFVFPTWIAPLFNKFSPLPDGPLKERIQNLVKRVGVNAKEVFVVDGSKRSKHANAYFTGFGKNRRIVLYDTLLQQLNEDEIEAVLAHELGHLKHKHVLKGLFLSLLLSLLFFYVLGLLAVDPDFYMKLGIPFNFMLPTGGTALILFMLVMPYVVFVFSPFGSWFSRKHEFEADRFAAHYSKAEYLASGLLKLYKENAASVVSDPLYVLFYASHPPIIQRLEALKQLKPTVV